MKTRKNPLSIRIIYWLTQISFWLFVAVFIAAIAFNIALQLELLGDKMQIHAGLMSEVKYTEKGSLYLFGQNQEVEFVEGTGKIHFINTNVVIAKWIGGLMLGIVSIFLYIFLMFKRFIGNVYRGDIFERFNIQMLQKMAYGLAGLWFFMIIYSRLFYYVVAKHIEFEHLEITGEMESYSYVLFIALFLWVLSHIFMTGVKLKDEQNLTV